MTEIAIAKREPVGIEAKIGLFALVYSGIAALLFWDSYIALLRDYLAAQLRFLPILLWVTLAISSVLMAPRAPVTFFIQALRRRWRGASAIILVFALSMPAFTTLKFYLPRDLDFYADGILADVDRLIHFGDPWRHVHAMLPDTVSSMLGTLYGVIWFAQWFGVLLFAAFVAEDRLRARYLLSLVMSFAILGTVLAACFASAGPILFDQIHGSDRFADLISILRSDSALAVIASNYLYSAYLHDNAAFGSGISAMPSMHIAVASLNALFLSSINRWTGRVWWLFTAAIMVGSVYSGWHYAIDGYVSLGLTVLIWRSTRPIMPG